MSDFFNKLLSYTKELFSFLETEYNYHLVECKKDGVTLILTYNNEFLDKKVSLKHDLREKFLYFSIINGINKKEHSDISHAHIKTFLEVFKLKDPNITIDDTQPQKDQDTRIALKRNADLLRKYGRDFLT